MVMGVVLWLPPPRSQLFPAKHGIICNQNLFSEVVVSDQPPFPLLILIICQ